MLEEKAKTILNSHLGLPKNQVNKKFFKRVLKLKDRPLSVLEKAILSIR
jgi:hypothetical protein